MGQYIDFEYAKKAFNRYVADFDANDKLINRKIYHSYNVVKFSKIVASEIGFDEENKELATLIALLHDIGRFIQAKEYHTFNDNISIDHADLGCKILFGEDELIRKFIKTDRYDPIIFLAIKNHNKFKIQSGLNDLELKHVKCIRDSDKIDIFPGFIDNEHKFFDHEEVKKNYITDKVFESVAMHETVLKSDMKNQNVDVILLTIALVFDLNYKVSLKIVKENKYIEKVVSKYYDLLNDETKIKVLEAQNIVLDYIDKKIED